MRGDAFWGDVPLCVFWDDFLEGLPLDTSDPHMLTMCASDMRHD